MASEPGQRLAGSEDELLPLGVGAEGPRLGREHEPRPGLVVGEGEVALDVAQSQTRSVDVLTRGLRSSEHGSPWKRTRDGVKRTGRESRTRTRRGDLRAEELPDRSNRPLVVDDSGERVRREHRDHHLPDGRDADTHREAGLR